MADPRVITENKSSSLNLQAQKTSSPKKPSQQANYLKREKLSDFSKKEFIEFIKEVSKLNGKTEAEDDKWVEKFDQLVPHPDKSDLLFWPPEGIETPEDIVGEIEKYCKENGLPCFKDK